MNRDIAFFTNPQLASSKTRGEQIAERLGASLNERFTKDDCPKNIVFVKCFPNEIDQIPRTTQIWYDPVDSDYALERIAERPNINVIAISESAERYLRARLKNKIFLIKEHHCNFNREVRPERPVEVVGFIGYKECFDLDFDTVASELAKCGLKFCVHTVGPETTRETVVDFYKHIDIQVTFRGPRLVTSMPPEMKNPLKVVNAASFGIPTVGYPELSYNEFPVFLSARNLQELISACYSVRCLPYPKFPQHAEAYHIDNIIERYKEVFNDTSV